MKWILIVLLTNMQGDKHEGLMWIDPVFKTSQECVDWTNNNVPEIIGALNYHVPNWEVQQFRCSREDELETLDIEPYEERQET